MWPCISLLMLNPSTKLVFMDFGIFYINSTLIGATLSDFFLRSASIVVLDLLAIGGWAILSYILIYTGIYLWVGYRRELYSRDWKWVLLAIDIPALNVQTPMAVEQLFSQLSGAYNHVDVTEKCWHGFKQRRFSFEIISLGGYIQFLVRTEEIFRDLVEAAIYAQYSDAEIVEVEDYVKAVPDHFPNEEYDVWATDFALTEDWAYPLRTFEEFEHKISKDTVLKDPMGTFLESFSRLGPGEQMWFQLMVEPISNHWKEKVIEKIEEMTGVDKSRGKSFADLITDFSLKSLETIGDQVFNREAGEKEEHQEERKELSPGQGQLIEGMENKIKKAGFRAKMRGVYIARKEVFKKERGMTALIGAVSQFNIPSANSLASVYKTAATSFFAKRITLHRKNILLNAYKKRKMRVGANVFILNIMELATIWHFPMSHVKTPLVQKATAKTAEPPSGLPVEGMAMSLPPAFGKPSTAPAPEKIVSTYLTDAGQVMDNDDVKMG